METQFDEKDSLKLIHEMIQASRNNIRDNAFFYLLWGWLVLCASIGHFVLEMIDFRYCWIPWPVLMTIGMIASVIQGIRLGKKSQVITHMDKAVIYLWYGFFFVVIILLAMAMAGKLAWEAANPLIITLYGLGTFVSGGILKFRPLIWGGVFCWVASVAAFYTPYPYLMLITGLSIIVAYLIPGYLLRKEP
jgi:hypothetical protein